MGQLGEALTLVHGARDRFATIRATIRVHFDGGLAREAEESFAATPQGRASGFGEALAEASHDDTNVGVRHGVIRLWVQKPDHVREETEGDLWGGTGISVRMGNRWRTYHPGEGVHSNDDDLAVGAAIGDQTEQLLDPSGLLAALRFEARGPKYLAGREAIRLRARPRTGIDIAFAVRLLSLGADEYDLIVDRERGVLLRAASLIDGVEFAVMEMVEVAFDEEIAPETFVLSPPEGEPVRTAWGVIPKEVTIQEAARFANFPVWFPALVSEDWRVTVVYVAKEAPSGEPESVVIRLWRDDATHQVSIAEWASGTVDPDDEWEAWEQFEWEGQTFESHEPDYGSAGLRFDREGTTITLTSDLGRKALLDLARSLERVGDK